MYVVVVDFTIKPEFVGRFRERVRQQARDSLEREPECHVFDVCIDPARDGCVLLYEVYSERGAFDAHLESTHFIDFDNSVRDWVESKQVACYARI